MNAQIIAISNQKGGVGKTTTCVNLGIGLARAGKKVLVVDGDSQGSFTISLGSPQPDKLPVTLADIMGKVLMDEPILLGEGICIIRRELMLTVNALAAANRVLIPVQAEYLPAKGLEQLLSTISKVRRQIYPKLQIDGILLTMVNSRTNFAKEISTLLRDTYGSRTKVFRTEIPHSVRAKETSAEGKSIYAHDPGGKVAEAYQNLTKEVLKIEKQREKCKAGISR